MKKLLQIPFLIAFSLISISSFASMEFWVDYKIFSIPNDQAYVETYINFTGNSLSYIAIDSNHVQSKVEILYYFKQENKIISYKKILLDSPVIEHGYTYIDFLDVQRFMLDDGKYELVIEVNDLNNSIDQKVYSEKFEIKRSVDKPYISNVSFLKGYSKADTPTDLTKSGYNLLPFVSNYFPSEFNSLIFYAEVYETNTFFGEGEKYALMYSIKDTKTKKVIGNNQVIKRQDVAQVTPILHTFDITDLPKGDYEISIEIRNKNNELITRQTQPFYRNKFIKSEDSDLTKDEFIVNQIDITNTFANQYQDKEELLDHLYSLTPIATSVETSTIDNVMPGSDLTTLQQYMYYFWSRRYDTKAEDEWTKYHKKVIYVDQMYGSKIKKGYQTDRGRVYLTYGKPSSIAKRHNNISLAPYEIWHYYEIKKYHDKRFLFYDQSKVGIDFSLLTSDMPSEILERNWYNIMIQTGGFKGRDRLLNQENSSEHGVSSNINSKADGEGEILKDLYFHTR